MSNGKTLSRDYKHVKRHTPGGSAFNGWVGLFAGLAIGLTVALGVHLHYQNLPAPEPQPTAEVPPASAAAPPEEATLTAGNAPDFEFYDMLPNQEVEVPEAALAKAAGARSALPRGDVTLQAGSFKQLPEAEKLQARLAQYGVDAKVQRISLEDETWYRVRIGPIATVEELESIRAKLAEAEIEVTPVTLPTVPAPP